MSKKQSTYTEESRREAIKLLESSGKSVPELAGELGINEKSLYRWRAKYGTSSARHQTDTQPDERDAELALEALMRSLSACRLEQTTTFCPSAKLVKAA